MISDHDEIEKRLKEINEKMSSIKKILSDNLSDIPSGLCSSIYRDLTSIEVDTEAIGRISLQLIDYICYDDTEFKYDGNVSCCLDKLKSQLKKS